MPAARPRIIVNFAITADGKVSTRNHTPAGFTSPADKRRLREIRSLGDAVLAGAGTVAADQMSMRLSDPDLQKARLKRRQSAEPLRVIVSNRGKLDPKWKVFQSPTPTLLVFSTTQMPERIRARIAPLCDLWIFESKTVDLAAMLGLLRSEYRVRTLICEGGPSLFRSLLLIDAVDEIRLTWAPVVFGGKEAPSLTGLPGEFLPHLSRCRLRRTETGDGECYLTYEMVRGKPKKSP